MTPMDDHPRPEPEPRGPWTLFVRWLAGAALAVFAGLLAFVVATDPYDTGRFALLRAPGVPAQTPRTAHASRGRDPAFDAAIIGNSHVQMLSPAGLSAATGLAFVTLSVPGTGPREQFVLLDYFLRHRTGAARALVIGIDPYWCRPDPALTPWLPFPFWLYDPSPWRYLAGLVRDQSLDDSTKRIGWVLGLSKRPRARPDGYWDYDEGLVWREDRQGVLFQARVPSTVPNETGPYPALDALAARLAALPAGLPVALVQPPVFHLALPEPGTGLARAEAACRAALGRVVAGRPGTALVDWRLDRPEARVPQNFIDPTHYRSAVARAVEADIATAIRGLSGGGAAPPRG